MQQTCAQCQNDFEIRPQDQQFYNSMNVPEPKLCISCRRGQLLVWRNQRTLYNRTCDATGKNITAIYPPQSPYTVYDRDHWWSDKWDPTDYARDFDFSKTFAENYDALLHDVPMSAVFNATTENCQYCNHVTQDKDCYLIFATFGSEKLAYCDMCVNDKDGIDNLETQDGTLNYECVQSGRCYNTNYADNSENCNDSWFLYNCKNLSDCIGCVNLRDKQYCIFNEPHTKEAYERKKSELKLETRAGIKAAKAKFETLKAGSIRRFAVMKNTENSTGDHLEGASNMHHCFSMRGRMQDCAYSIHAIDGVTSVRDTYGVGVNFERAYFAVDCGLDCRDHIATVVCYACSFTYYSYNCHSCFEIFGCSGLRNKKYHILNKPYTEDEYKTMKGRIIEHMKQTGEWGNMFAPHIAPFAYNETLAQEIAPLTKETALQRGFKWTDAIPETRGKGTITAQQVPQTIAEVRDDALKQVLTCAACERNYKIVPIELDFYRKKNLPLPTHCPKCRYEARLDLRNPYELHHRPCDCALAGHETHTENTRCPNEFETPYAPERPEQVFCEHCYQKEVL